MLLSTRVRTTCPQLCTTAEHSFRRQMIGGIVASPPVLVYRCMNGTAPRYLGSELQRVADIESIGVCDLHHHRRCMFHGRCTRPSAIVPSPLPLQKSGTCCRQRSRHCRHWTHSSVHWRLNCSVDHTATHTTGNSTTDTSETRDTQRPWSFCKTCVAMKFVDDDDDDDCDHC